MLSSEGPMPGMLQSPLQGKRVLLEHHPSPCRRARAQVWPDEPSGASVLGEFLQEKRGTPQAQPSSRLHPARWSQRNK